MRKTSISQRWEEKFVDKAKIYAKKADCSVTQFTIDSITLLGSLLDNKELILMTNEERTRYITSALSNHRGEKPETRINLRKKKYNQVEDFLMANPSQKYSTIQISEVLKINQATVRTYVKRLGARNNFILYEGRPNSIMYEN